MSIFGAHSELNRDERTKSTSGVEFVGKATFALTLIGWGSIIASGFCLVVEQATGAGLFAIAAALSWGLFLNALTRK